MSPCTLSVNSQITQIVRASIRLTAHVDLSLFIVAAHVPPTLQTDESPSGPLHWIGVG